MTEVEVKILDIDVAAVAARLRELGAQKVFEGNIQADLYDFPDKRLDAQDSFARLRSKGEETELVVKKRIPDTVARSYHELEVVVSDRQAAHDILKALGLVQTVIGRNKHRISYALPGVHFEIDTIEGMPTFLEIEVSDSSEVKKWVEALGFAMEDAKPWSGKDVYRHYGVEYPRV